MTFLVEYAKEQAAFGGSNQNTGGDDERIMVNILINQSWELSIFVYTHHSI